MTEVEDLTLGRGEMQQVVAINPFRCRMWDFHDRLQAELTEHTCRTEIESFSKHGQLIPVLGRPLHGRQDYDVELIYGARRLFAAQHLNKPLMVNLRPVPDNEAFIAMDIENRVRKDISPYERALSYSQWLRHGHFNSQDELARTLRVSPSQVSRLLKLAQLPTVVVQAFGDPTNICEGWGVKLSGVLEDPDRRQALLATARAIIADHFRHDAPSVYRQLLATPACRKQLKQMRHHHDIVIRGTDGAAVLRIRQQRDSVAFVVPIESLEGGTKQDICDAIAGILRNGRSQPEPPGGACSQKPERVTCGNPTLSSD
jgi:ParB family chromosome partitioning protein